MTTQTTPIRRALISVSEKSGIIEFAQALNNLGVEILSTGGTFKLLKDNGIKAIEVSDYTEFPEMMDGRVKTLHPKIHGGILGRRGIDDNVMLEHGIQPIDMVVVNLYPFKETIAKPDSNLAMAIENIDIGGPTMVRSAAKNHKDTAVVVNSSDYQDIISALQENNGLNHKTRFDLAVKAFEHSAQYDGMIANYLGSIIEKTGEEAEENNPFPRTLNLQFIKAQTMRYGENPHQRAAFYTEAEPNEASVSTAKQLNGKALSFNNVADTDAALESVKSFSEPACVIVKHANPCGVAIGDDILQAYHRAYQTDPTSAFGGIIAFNHTLDEVTARTIIERQFVEVIIAPNVSPEAANIIATKPNIRLLESGSWTTKHPAEFDYKRVNGGLLIQDKDLGSINADSLRIVTQTKPTSQQIEDLLFCWKVAKSVKSNAIVYAKDLQTIGIGAGQMSRVYSARIAGIKAIDEGLNIQNAVMASDAFFPFRDGIDSAAEAGIKAIIQPGGSVRDSEVIAAADEHNIAMVFTGMRHFRH